MSVSELRHLLLRAGPVCVVWLVTFATFLVLSVELAWIATLLSPIFTLVLDEQFERKMSCYDHSAVHQQSPSEPQQISQPSKPPQSLPFYQKDQEDRPHSPPIIFSDDFQSITDPKPIYSDSRPRHLFSMLETTRSRCRVQKRLTQRNGRNRLQQKLLKTQR